MANEAQTAGKAAENLYVQLIGDGRSYGNMLNQAVKQTEQASQAIAQETKKITEAVKNDVAEDSAILQHMTESKLAKIGQRAVGTGLIIVGLVRRMIDAFQSFESEAVQAFQESEMAGMRLTGVLEANGAAVEDTMERYEEFAAAMKETSTMSSTTVKQLLASAGNFGMVGNSAMRAVRDAQALAARKGGDPGSWIRALSMLQQGQVAREFMRLTPEIKKAKTEAEKIRLINKFIAESQRFISKEAATSAGLWKQMRNEIGDVMEILGKTIVTALKPFVTFARDAARWFQRLSEPVQNMISKLIQLLSIVVVATTAWSIWGAAIKDVFYLILSFISPFWLLVGGAVAAIVYFTGAWDGLLDTVKVTTEGIKSYFMEMYQTLVSAIKRGDLPMAWKIFSAGARAAFIDVANFLGESWSTIWDQVVKQAKAVFWELVALFTILGNWIGERLMAGLFGGDTAEIDKRMEEQMKRMFEVMKKHHPKFDLSSIVFDPEKFANAARDELRNLTALDELIQQKEFFEKFGFVETNPEFRKWWEEQAAMVDRFADLGYDSGAAMSNEFAKALRFDAAEAGTAEAMARIREFMDTGGIGGEGGGGKGALGAIGVGGGTAGGQWDIGNGPDLGDVADNTANLEMLLEGIRINTGRDPIVFNEAALA